MPLSALNHGSDDHVDADGRYLSDMRIFTGSSTSDATSGVSAATRKIRHLPARDYLQRL